MLNSAAACGHTQTTEESISPIATKPQIKWMAWFSKIGRTLSLSHVVMHK
ncbi:hypothetical protein [Pseudoalteromonas luteoviolacea]|uniref:Uncharacterized protein n=1 Tax=Pseudoalteromonas luteoviolacea H33 TaxID=1365251 RepID=A0A167FGR8_9GAMM|nr:hypothetical protein [Pseudoalteromonas luteoviolacea]KZN52266.1 hypothetical protein N476_11550 [Pseudoalteromonas luteoviolacea H33]KZN75767.1 hypothetical protein N477_17630 [Pseudoalteromonas luteoviolacea H33-S]MBQ4879186.1 hypothetical protein [Pseudoalteromonas luteoviolacea]MBQ4908246.1 hypothetical protein [Pseudoalteromonas luteoviolacea]